MRTRLAPYCVFSVLLRVARDHLPPHKHITEHSLTPTPRYLSQCKQFPGSQKLWILYTSWKKLPIFINITLYSIDHYEIIITYSSIQKKKSVKTKQITNFLCIYYAHTTIYVGSFVIWCMMSDVHSWIIDINSPVSVAQRSVYFPTDFSTPGRCQGPGRRARPRSSPSPPSPGWTQAPCWPCPWQPPSWVPSSTIIW